MFLSDSAERDVADPSMSDVSRGPGWWLASDGRWYPPEAVPGYAAPIGQPGPGWWLASDGRWYPPHTAPGGGSPTPLTTWPTPSTSFGPLRRLDLQMAATCILVLVGTLTTWASVSFGVISASVSGVQTNDGTVVLVLAILAGLTGIPALRGSTLRTGPALLGTVLLGASAVVCIVQIVQISTMTIPGIAQELPANGFLSFEAGFGLWLCAFASVIGVVQGIRIIRYCVVSGRPNR